MSTPCDACVLRAHSALDEVSWVQGGSVETAVGHFRLLDPTFERREQRTLRQAAAAAPARLCRQDAGTRGDDALVGI
jgi:hypothetical protein